MTFLWMKRNAVVTGGNKGMGFEICKQLASKGVKVILTARDAKKGLEAVEKLRATGLSLDQITFHQLDVEDAASVANLEDFVKTEFGKLDILVNNAGISGGTPDEEKMKKLTQAGKDLELSDFLIQTYELAEQCIQTNYHGTKKMVQDLLPVLQLSDSPRIVNVTSSLGRLMFVPGEKIKAVLRDTDNLTEEKLDALVNEFLVDFDAGSSGKKGWPTEFPAYQVSKAAANAYTRLLANKYPKMCINAVCPGFVKTYI
ncbi:hypothetical protein QQ045_007626 [Rhodiola kirilowii]